MPDRQLSRCINVDDVRELVKLRLPRPMYYLMSYGVEDGVTFRSNVTGFQKCEIDRQVLIDVSTVDTEVRVLGCKLRLPLILAPTGGQGVFHAGGEVAAARAAARGGIMYSYPTFGHYSPEEVADVGPGPRRFQVYASIDDRVNEELIRPAKENKYDALCLTVDQPVSGRVERFARWGRLVDGHVPLRTTLAMLLKPAWLWSQRALKRHQEPFVVKLLKERGHHFPGGTPIDMANWAIRRGLTWEDAAALRKRWDGPFVLKGITNLDDARRAASIGASAIVVCSHGGISIDGCPSSISVLEKIADAVGSQIEVLLGRGIRRGTSMLKSIAIGAKATLVGRPFLYGLAAAGEEGVYHDIELLRAEFEIALRQCGCASPAELSRQSVRRQGGWQARDQLAEDCDADQGL